MYLPPPGRPISRPPNDEPESGYQPFSRPYRRVTDEERTSIAADYAAGMSWREMSGKYDRSPAVLGGILSGIKKRTNSGRPPNTPPRPVRLPDEEQMAYANRVQAWKFKYEPGYAERFAESRAKAVRAAAKAGRKQAINEAKSLNAAETRGRWVMVRDIMAEQGVSRAKAGHYLVGNSIERRKFKMGVTIYLLPHKTPVVPAPAPAEMVPVAMTPPPSFWQRFIGWFR